MIRQRQPHTVAQFGIGKSVRSIKQDGAIAAVVQFRIKLANVSTRLVWQ